MKVMLLCLLVALPAFGAQERGNGGDAIVCANGQVTFYDMAEMEKRYHFAPDIPAGANWQEITGKLIDRLQAINPSRALRFRQRLSAFQSEADFLSGVDLIDVPDTGVGVIPAGCELKQLVVQRPPRFPGEKRYLVSKDLWDRIDEANRAVLVLHEVILGDAIEDEHQTSESARYLNGLITGNRLTGLTAKAYFELLRQLEFKSADYHGVSISVPSAKWDNDQLLEAGTPAHLYIDQENVKGTAECEAEMGLLRFSPSGDLREFFGKCSVRHLAYARQTEDGLVSGNLESFWLRPDGSLDVQLRGGKTEVQFKLLKISAEREDPGTAMDIAKDGKLRSLRAACSASVDVRCPSFGEAFYRDQWRKVSLVEYAGGKVRDVILETPARAKLGWLDASFDQVQTGDDYTEYYLTGSERFKFANATLRVERVQLSLARPDQITYVALGEPFRFRSQGETYYCDRGDYLAVSGRSLVLSTEGPCRNYQ